VIVAQPAGEGEGIDPATGNAYIDAGGSATLQAGATSSGALSLQWYVGQRGNTSTPVMGGTTATLVVSPSVTTSYWLQATTAAGVADSQTVTIIVRAVTYLYAVDGGEPQALSPDDVVDLGDMVGKTLEIAVSSDGLPTAITAIGTDDEDDLAPDDEPPVNVAAGGQEVLTFTPTEEPGEFEVKVQLTVNGVAVEFTFQFTTAPWFELLVSNILAATGAACTHAAFVGAPTTTKNGSGDPAGDGDRIFRVFDLIAGAYDYIEGDTDKGGIYRAASVGTRAAMQLDRSNQEYLKTVKNANAETEPLIPAGAHTVILVGKFPDNNAGSSTLRFNPLIWGSSDMGSAASAAPSLLLRDDTAVRVGGYTADGVGLAVDENAAPYDTPLVLSLRNKLDPDGLASVGSGKDYVDTPSNASIGSLAKRFHMGFGADYLSGHIAGVIVLDAALDDAAMDDVVDLCEAAFGI